MIIAVDPGSSSGAIAVRDNLETFVANLHAESNAELLQQIGGACGLESHNRVVMEDVGGAMPGNAAKSARTFAAHVGALRMAIVAATGDEPELVRPQIWMKDLFGDRLPRAAKGASAEERAVIKRQRKQFIYDEMKQRYPDLKFSLRQADAVGILAWCLQK